MKRGYVYIGLERFGILVNLHGLSARQNNRVVGFVFEQL